MDVGICEPVCSQSEHNVRYGIIFSSFLGLWVILCRGMLVPGLAFVPLVRAGPGVGSLGVAVNTSL